MEIRVLNYFLAVAREENITKAAALLHITQPTLSRQLRQLEEELGVRLFVRSNHSIVLTEQGQLLRRRAQELVELSEKMKQELTQEENLKGELAIGSGEYQSSRLLAGIMAAFQELNPQVWYSLYSGNSDDIKERIERGLLDVGFLLEPVEVEKYEFIRSPMQEEWGAMVHKDSELAGKAYVTAEDLAGRPLIFTQRGLVRQEILNWFGNAGEHLNIIAGGNLAYNMAVYARERKEVFVNLNKECTYDGMVYVPLWPKITSNTVLAWKKLQTKAPVMRAFVDFAKKYMNGITEHRM